MNDTNVIIFFKDFVIFFQESFLWFFIEDTIERVNAKTFEKNYS